MEPKLRVLVVDDDREDFMIARDALEEHRPGRYQLEWAADYEQGLTQLLTGEYEVGLIDYTLGARTGLELLRTTVSAGCEVPIIFLTALPNPDLDLEAVRSGASDFMLKSKLDPDRLDRSIRYAIERKKTQKVVSEQQKQLALTLKMAALGEMAGGIAHEILNPMTIAQGRAQELRRLAEQGSLDPRTIAKIAEDILNSTQRMTRIVKSLRNFTRTIHEGEHPAVRVQCVFEDVTRLCSERFLKAGVRLEVIETSHEAQIECNPSEASQAIFILLNNAIDAVENLPEKWVRMEFHAHTEYDEIWVTDSGKGIPREHHEKIFAPFFTTKAPNKGTGLGLSIAQRIMDAHGGQLSIDHDCTNTRFQLRFRRQRLRSNTEAERERSVLIVEDDDLNLNFVSEAFRRRGFEVFTASNGEEGFQFLSQKSVGAVVTDIRMPICDGIRMIERLRSENKALPPVFFMTGFYERSPASDSLTAGAAGVYDKPFDVTALVNHVLSKVLGSTEFMDRTKSSN